MTFALLHRPSAAVPTKKTASQRKPRGKPKAFQQPLETAREDARPQSQPKAGTTSANRCRVDVFKLSVEPWNVSWPYTQSGSTDVYLPVEFELKLGDGSTREDCLIEQLKKGRTEGGGTEEFSSWTVDADVGLSGRYWWDGTNWQVPGSWDSTFFGLFNERATFRDEPGFHDAPASFYPLVWSGPGGKGQFRFRTRVLDRATGNPVRELSWGLSMNHPKPRVGRHFFSL